MLICTLPCMRSSAGTRVLELTKTGFKYSLVGFEDLEHGLCIGIVWYFVASYVYPAHQVASIPSSL